MGSLALELKFNDLKNQLPELIRELKKVEALSSLPKLSVDAQQLLAEGYRGRRYGFNNVR
jgi:hypothetical protein